MSKIDFQKSSTVPNLAEATRVWWKIGILSFGGPAAQIALMHKEIVEDRGWLSEQQYLNALSLCMLLPGPEAMQMATYVGWRLQGIWGGLMAGLLFVLPGAAVIMVLATIYSFLGDVPLLSAFFYGIKAAVLIIVLEALIRVSKKALTKKAHWIVSGLAFSGIFFLSIPYPIIVALAAFWGWVSGGSDKATAAADIALVPMGQTFRTVLVWLAIWASPFFVLWASGANQILTEIGVFFSMLAVVTFGGAYAVLAYMAQDVVMQLGWLSAGEMIDALGLAETTPGPLILVTQFVGFVAGFKEGGVLLALAAAFMALWVTFIPCFLWIFAGGPYIEWISNQPKLRGALAAITAAVVGVILNLSIWFGLHVLFADVQKEQWGLLILWLPTASFIEWLALGLFVLNGILAFQFRWNIIKILLLSSLLSSSIGFFF